MFLRLWTRAPRTSKTSCWAASGAMGSMVAKGQPRQRAFRAVPKLQSIRLAAKAGKSQDFPALPSAQDAGFDFHVWRRIALADGDGVLAAHDEGMAIVPERGGGIHPRHAFDECRALFGRDGVRFPEHSLAGRSSTPRNHRRLKETSP